MPEANETNLVGDKLWDKIPVHLQAGLGRYLYNHAKPGDFLMAVLSNDLMGALAHGDEESIAGLRDLIAYLYWEVGVDCYGSKETVDKWLKNEPAIQVERSETTIERSEKAR